MLETETDLWIHIWGLLKGHEELLFLIAPAGSGSRQPQ